METWSKHCQKKAAKNKLEEREEWITHAEESLEESKEAYEGMKAHIKS